MFSLSPQPQQRGDMMKPYELEHVIDVVAENGVPFRVVYGYRTYTNGSKSLSKVLAVYDRRQDPKVFGPNGQFVTDAGIPSIVQHGPYGWNMYGGEDDWTLDSRTMVRVLNWLSGVL